MKLIAIFKDIYSVGVNLQHLNVATIPKTRRIEVDLTDEQAMQLRPEHVGRNQGKDYHENLTELFLEDASHD